MGVQGIGGGTGSRGGGSGGSCPGYIDEADDPIFNDVGSQNGLFSMLERGVMNKVAYGDAKTALLMKASAEDDLSIYSKYLSDYWWMMGTPIDLDQFDNLGTLDSAGLQNQMITSFQNMIDRANDAGETDKAAKLQAALDHIQANWSTIVADLYQTKTTQGFNWGSMDIDGISLTTFLSELDMGAQFAHDGTFREGVAHAGEGWSTQTVKGATALNMLLEKISALISLATKIAFGQNTMFKNARREMD